MNKTSSLKKQVEMQLESQHLDEIINLIKEEILFYIDLRNKTNKSLLNYRKKVLEEYKDDEDKIIEYFDHERFIAEETYKKVHKKLKEMNVLKEQPYFGSIDFLDKEFDEKQKMYIGRFGFTKIDEIQPTIVDWRAPIASLFYESKTGDTEYNAPDGKVPVTVYNKRQYIIKNSKLDGMFDSSIDIKDEILQMILSKNSEDKLKDIIMTIQKEQDEIIREDKDKIIVVNGVAGSGKTTIALHRIAYLLYNFREKLDGKVIIFGPNNIFMDYISTVLPSLGESGVKQKTFQDFACDILNVKDLMDFGTYMEKVMNNDEKFIDEIKYKTSIKYKKDLDSLIIDIENNMFKYKDVKIDDKIVITKEEIKELFYKYYSYMPLFRRNKKIKRIIFSKIKDIRNEFIREIELKYKKIVDVLTKEELELQENDIKLKRQIEIKDVIQKVIETKRELIWLNNPSCVEIYNDFNNQKQLTVDDLAPILYLKIKLEGFKSQTQIKHIVIDEAQDYSILQFIVIKDILNCSSMTIVGDRNQRIIPINEELAMFNLKEYTNNCNIKHFELTKSYRSTMEIMKYANKFLNNNNIIPLVRNGKPVKEYDYENNKQLKDLLISSIEDLQTENYKSIGIICNSLNESKEIFDLIKDKIYVKLFDNDDLIYKGGTVIIPSYYAKGLEFDSVILVKDGIESQQMNQIKYVMSTRALHQLIVLENN